MPLYKPEGILKAVTASPARVVVDVTLVYTISHHTCKCQALAAFLTLLRHRASASFDENPLLHRLGLQGPSEAGELASHTGLLLVLCMTLNLV